MSAAAPAPVHASPSAVPGVPAGSGSFNVRFWTPARHLDRRSTRWRARWAVDGRERCRSFRTRAYAEAFLTELKTAARDGTPFHPGTGLPVTAGPPAPPVLTWFDHARSYAAARWPDLAAKSRISTAEALAAVTEALLPDTAGRPGTAAARRVLITRVFRRAATTPAAPRPISPAQAAQATVEDQIVAWIAAHSPPLSDLANPAVLRRALDACARTSTGAAAAPSTARRKRAVLHHACVRAVEDGLLPVNPFDRVRWKPPQTADTIDRRRVPNPDQVRALLDAVAAQGERGRHLLAFFGCLYYAALRPCEAIALTAADCHLPDTGWGRLDLHRSHARAAAAWTDTATTHDRRGLKHRATGTVRPVPIPPVLVAMLRDHLATHGTTDDGLLFRTRRGQPLTDSTYRRIWLTARAAALTPGQAASPLAARPYDLRHAAVTLWLNAGVPAPDVAARAGHSTHVLLTVYAGCLDNAHHNHNTRIQHALGGAAADPQPAADDAS
jgi:integrase